MSKPTLPSLVDPPLTYSTQTDATIGLSGIYVTYNSTNQPIASFSSLYGLISRQTIFTIYPIGQQNLSIGTLGPILLNPNSSSETGCSSLIFSDTAGGSASQVTSCFNYANQSNFNPIYSTTAKTTDGNPISWSITPVVITNSSGSAFDYIGNYILNGLFGTATVYPVYYSENGDGTGNLTFTNNWVITITPVGGLQNDTVTYYQYLSSTQSNGSPILQFYSSQSTPTLELLTYSYPTIAGSPSSTTNIVYGVTGVNIGTSEFTQVQETYVQETGYDGIAYLEINSYSNGTAQAYTQLYQQSSNPNPNVNTYYSFPYNINSNFINWWSTPGIFSGVQNTNPVAPLLYQSMTAFIHCCYLVSPFYPTNNNFFTPTEYNQNQALFIYLNADALYTLTNSSALGLPLGTTAYSTSNST